MFRPGQILPPMLIDRLGLSSEQIEQLEALQTEVRERLEKILTEEQRARIRQMAARGPQGPGAEGRGPRGDRRPGAEGRRSGGDRGPGAGRSPEAQRRRAAEERAAEERAAEGDAAAGDDDAPRQRRERPDTE